MTLPHILLIAVEAAAAVGVIVSVASSNAIRGGLVPLRIHTPTPKRADRSAR